MVKLLAETEREDETSIEDDNAISRQASSQRLPVVLI